MCGGADGAGQRLQIDVRLVDQPLADFLQQGATGGNPGAGAQPGCLLPGVVAEQAVECFERNQGVVAGDQRRKRVAAAENSRLFCLAQHDGQLGFVLWAEYPARVGV